MKKDNATLQNNRYDFQQRRIVKTASSTTYFLYGETGLIGEYQSNGDFIQGYGYYPKTSYTTNPVYTLKENGTSYDFDFYHNDHLATPQKLTNNAGTVSWAMESNAFGEVTIKTQTTKNNLRFPGQYADNNVGLSQNYYRDYMPTLGRYFESDPIRLDGGINVYQYSYSNPLVYFDTLGFATWKGVYYEGSITKVATYYRKAKGQKIPAGYDVSVLKPIEFYLVSECFGEKKYRMKVVALASGLAAGKSSMKDISMGAGGAEFEDHSSFPNPNAFNGLFSYTGLSVAFSYTFGGETMLGNATGNIGGLGLTTDLWSVEVLSGISLVDWVQEIPCCTGQEGCCDK